MTHDGRTTSPQHPDATAGPSRLTAEDAGYRKSLGRRQMQMIAIGGAIGTGLFLGAGRRLHEAGPSLAVVYAVCGAFAFLILRALGELVLHRPTSGSFVSYAREFFGEKAAFVAGWMYFLFWAMTGIVDITAVALYVHYWGAFEVVPQWVIALVALALITGINMVGVKWFGEMEFWFSMIKVAALTVFLVVGTVLLAARVPVAGHETGPGLIFANGGFFPADGGGWHGVLAAIVLAQGVVFAYAGIELVGTAAGETKDPEKVMPGAVNAVIWRIGLFYVGSVLLLVMLLPWTAYRDGQSPFVTFFAALGVPGIGSLMNVVVLTAALSSLNSGLYSTGRVLRSLSIGGSAPRFVGRMNAHGVPWGGILTTVAIDLAGVALNYFVPDAVFEIVLNVSALGIISTWAVIVLCHLAFRRRVAAGLDRAPSFRMPGAPATSWVTLAFLATVVVLMALDYPVGTFTTAAIPVIAGLLVGGWYLVRGRVREQNPKF